MRRASQDSSPNVPHSLKPIPNVTPLNDRWLRLTGVGLLIGLLGLGHFVISTSPVTPKTWTTFTVDSGAVLAFWEINRLLITRLRRRLPGFRRVAASSLAGIATTSLISAVFHVLKFWVEHGALAGVFESFKTTLSISVNNRNSTTSYLATNLLNSTVNFLLFYGLYELFFLVRETQYSNARLQRAEREKTALEKAALQSQLEALKQQINPHFLFNSLNILDALIEEEPAQARTFLDELASVYRYLLRANEHPLTPLAAELDFIRSYFHLLKTRHGLGLHLDLRVRDRFQRHQLPPLTLQLLVENAVKHNVVLPDQPLRIEIRTDEGGQLVVSNNLQRKKTRVLSNGVGLSNILTQYRMLGQPAPVVTDDGGEFVVTLPLVEP